MYKMLNISNQLIKITYPEATRLSNCLILFMRYI